MPIDHISSLLNALAKGPPIPGAHNRSWGGGHSQAHDGGRGGFPLGGPGTPDISRPLPGGPRIDGPHHPHGGPPGLDRPHFPHGAPPGLDRPNLPSAGAPGTDRPGHPHGGPPGLDRATPGRIDVPGVVRDVVNLPQQLPGLPGASAAQLPSLAATLAPAPPATAHTQGHGMTAGAPATAAMLGPSTTVLQATGQQHAPTPQPLHSNASVRTEAVAPHAYAAPPARPDAAQALPSRSEPTPAPVPRGDAAAAERMAALQRTAAAPMPLAHAAPANTAANAANAAANGPAAIATAAAGATMVAAPAAQAATQAADARNANPLVGADRGQVVARTDISGTYTGEGPYRRGMRRASQALPGGLSTLLMALGAQGSTGAAGRDPAAIERELRATMMQWLFWLLAVIAYGCVAFAVIGLLPPGSLGGGSRVTPVDNRAWTAGFALAGLVAALGAWWFARSMARGGGGDDGPGPAP